MFLIAYVKQQKSHNISDINQKLESDDKIFSDLKFGLC
jgi:hypothetical protein